MQSPDGLHSDFGYFDLNTATLVKIKDIAQPVNAFGYSRGQKVFWGMYTNINPDQLVRIDSKGNATTPITPIPGVVKTNTGTIGLYNGQEALFLHTKEPANRLVIVDIDPAGGTVGDVLLDVPLSRATPGVPENYLRIGDWDFNPIDGLLYSLEMEGDTIRRLVTIDPTANPATVTTVKDLSDRLPDGQNYGAVYVEDFSGTVYVGNNDVNDIFNDGGAGFSQTFGYYPALDLVIPYTPGTKGQALLINDGADCLVATDFGDAPDTYSTLNPNGGPGHIFSEVGDPNTYDFFADRKLRLGTEIDSDLDGLPTPGADGDDLNLPTNDEDGVPAGTIVNPAAPTLTVPITNATGAAAVLAGWIDFNKSGTFEASERAVAAVPAAGGSVTLNWPPTAAAEASSTYLRLRLYEAADPLAADPQPTGADFAVGGEIEDHIIGLGGSLPITGNNIGDLVKAGVLLVICGGLGFAMGGQPIKPRRRPSPRPRRA